MSGACLDLENCGNCWFAIFYKQVPLLIGQSAVLFLLLVRYILNVVKRSIWDQCKKKYILRTDRPTTDLTFGKISNGHNYLRKGSSDPLHVWFYGVVFGVGKSNGAISGLTKWRCPLGRHLGEFKWWYLRGRSCDLLRVWFWDGVFQVGRSNGAISGLTESKMAAL